MDETKTPVEFTKISVEEGERRRTHVRIAIADSRIEGMTMPSPEEEAIFDAYIRGEIEAGDLVNTYKDGRFSQGPQRAGWRFILGHIS